MTSVATPSQVQATFCATLIDEWVRAGLRDVVICPGSRSTPLALAMSARDEIAVHVRIDERSAAFFALGRALVTRRAVAVVVTSGTAAAELHAAVAEADLARVPLLILTADRPPELRDIGAPQTMNQAHLFGSQVRRFIEPGVARSDAMHQWRPLASRAWRAAAGYDDGPAGPVHLNLAFIAPLVAEPLELPAGREDGEMWTFAPAMPAVRSGIDISTQKVLCVVGAGVSASLVQELWSLDWAVIGDATTAHTLPYADPLARSDERAAALRPDVVVRIGGAPASKVLAGRLREWGARVIGFTGAGFVADPDGLLTDRLPGLPDVRSAQLRGDHNYVMAWAEASRRVGEHLASLDTGPLQEISVARAVVEASVRHQVPLMVGSSMPIRDVEWWSPSRVQPVYANRGVNGIDGVVSTAMGVATGTRALALVGDVTFLHDVSGLVDGVNAASTLVLVVSDNRGGGIFNFLPQATELASERFETLFATQHHHDLVAIACAFGHHGERVDSVEALQAAIASGLDRGGVNVIVAAVPDRDDNVLIHNALVRHVGEW